MSDFKINIGVEDILLQREKELTKTVQTTFDIKNYLQARLGDKEDSKEMTIRLLPYSPEGGSPFQKVFMHMVRVNKEVSPSGWKRFPCPNRNHLDGECPFCETAEYARKLKKEATNEVDRKRFDEAEMSNYARSMWVVRCIERGHEEDGVKFWLFSDSKNKDGVYDKIFAIFKKRLEKGKNIFDVNEGKDLTLTLTKDVLGKTRITITDDDDLTPLTEDEELGLSWINDPKKWTDVYKVKPYEYMSVVLNGGVPVYDKELKKFVDKNSQTESKNEEVKETNESIPKFEEIPVEFKSDYSSSVPQNVDDEEDDLPF